MAGIGILIIDDDVASQRALWHVLDSEGWRVRVVPRASQALAELATGDWTLVLANVALTRLIGPVFTTLKELAQAEAAPRTQDRKSVRVLFLVPLPVARQAQPVLERDGLPYSLKPYHLHDFLEKISDLLIEMGAIAEPIRSMRKAPSENGRRRKERSPGGEHRRTAMFASREDYQMTEEEIAEYEKQEKEEERQKKQEEKEKEVF